MAEITEMQKQWAKIVAKAWADEGFKERLLNDPAAVLTEEGGSVPEEMKLHVVESSEKEVWLVLPPKPSDEQIAEMGEERLAAMSALCGACSMGACMAVSG